MKRKSRNTENWKIKKNKANDAGEHWTVVLGADEDGGQSSVQKQKTIVSHGLLLVEETVPQEGGGGGGESFRWSDFRDSKQNSRYEVDGARRWLQERGAVEMGWNDILDLAFDLIMEEKFRIEREMEKMGFGALNNDKVYYTYLIVFDEYVREQNVEWFRMSDWNLRVIWWEKNNLIRNAQF